MSEAVNVAIVLASSRVGLATIKELVANHSGTVTIRASFRTAERAACLGDLIDKVQVVTGVDAFDKTSHKDAFEGIERALIVAPQLENRHEAVNALLDSAKAAGCKHVVLIGGVFQEEEKFIFHRQWMASRRHAESIGLAWTQLECVNFMENFLGQRANLRDGLMVVPQPHGASPAIALVDIAKAASTILTSPNGAHHNCAYKMTGPRAVTPVEMAEYAATSIGRPILVQELSIEEAEQANKARGTPAWQAEGFAAWQRVYLATGRMATVQSDLPKLGIQPTSFETWFDTNKPAFV